MTKTDNITRYTCDRCGESAYLQHGVAAAGDKACTDAYKQLAAKQDVELQTFMAAKEQR